VGLLICSLIWEKKHHGEANRELERVSKVQNSAAASPHTFLLALDTYKMNHAYYSYLYSETLWHKPSL